MPKESIEHRNTDWDRRQNNKALSPLPIRAYFIKVRTATWELLCENYDICLRSRVKRYIKFYGWLKSWLNSEDVGLVKLGSVVNRFTRQRKPTEPESRRLPVLESSNSKSYGKHYVSLLAPCWHLSRIDASLNWTSRRETAKMVISA